MPILRIMSSHHFVREGQEPALILANGAPCSMELLNDLVAWSPKIMVLDGAYYKAMDRQIQFDMLVGDFDSIGHIPTNFPFPVEVMHTPDQNKTDLQKGLEIFLEKETEAVNILWATGGRLDHQMANLNVVAKFSSLLTLNIIDDYTKVYPIKSPFKKYFKAGQQISLIPMGAVTQVSTTNLCYNLHNQTLETVGLISSSNAVAHSGIVEITFESGVLFAMEGIDL